MRDLHVFTNRYQEFRPGSGAPIRTTVGNVRFRLPYDLAGTINELAPWGLMKLPEVQFRVAYHTQLDSHGPERIWGLLQATARKIDVDALVLLCFCDLTKAGAYCHRRVFAEWFQTATGFLIPELGRTGDPGPGSQLF